VTARDLQGKDGQWTRAKGFDTFAPIGPWIVTDLDPRHLEISAYLNGERHQHSNTENLIFGPHQLVSFISRVMTLLREMLSPQGLLRESAYVRRR